MILLYEILLSRFRGFHRKYSETIFKLFTVTPLSLVSCFIIRSTRRGDFPLAGLEKFRLYIFLGIDCFKTCFKVFKVHGDRLESTKVSGVTEKLKFILNTSDRGLFLKLVAASWLRLILYPRRSGKDVWEIM